MIEKSQCCFQKRIVTIYNMRILIIEINIKNNFFM